MKTDWTAQYEAAERAREWLALTPLAFFVACFICALGALITLKRHRH